MNRRMTAGRVGSKTMTLVLALVLGVAASRPQPAEAAVAATTCADGAWAAYNECLVESESFFGKKLCDLDFMAAYYLCAEQCGY